MIGCPFDEILGITFLIGVWKWLKYKFNKNKK